VVCPHHCRMSRARSLLRVVRCSQSEHTEVTSEPARCPLRQTLSLQGIWHTYLARRLHARHLSAEIVSLSACENKKRRMLGI
jgi:hypothetical protein